MRIAAAHVDVTGVVPTLRRVGEQVDGAHGRADDSYGTISRRGGRDGSARRQDSIVDELEDFEGAARADGAGARRRIVDEVGALKMNAACPEIADFESGLAVETLLDRGAPLLDILCGSVRVKGRKAHRGRAEDCGIEIERRLSLCGAQQRGGGIEIVKLLGLREDKRHVMLLVAPGIQINGREENSVGAVENYASVSKVMGNAEARSEIVFVRVHESVWISILAADEDLWSAALEREVCVGVRDVVHP